MIKQFPLYCTCATQNNYFLLNSRLDCTGEGYVVCGMLNSGLDNALGYECKVNLLERVRSIARATRVVVVLE